MSFLVVGFMLSFLVPILIGSWRVGFLALGVQALLLASATLGVAEDYNLSTLLQMVDLVVVRGFIVPIILISTVNKKKIPSEFDFVPANFLYWTLLFLIVGSGLWFGHLIFINDFQKALQCGVAASGIAVSFFVLSLQGPGLGQLFAILLLESSIVLFEFLSPHHLDPILQVGISALFLSMVLVLGMFLGRLTVLTSSDVSEEDKDLI